MKIYIAGKITGLPLEEAQANFQVIEDMLNQWNMEVVNPMKLPHNHDKEWSSYMKECISALLECDGIWRLDNCKDSKGAKLELKIAKSIGLHLFSNKII